MSNCCWLVHVHQQVWELRLLQHLGSGGVAIPSAQTPGRGLEAAKSRAVPPHSPTVGSALAAAASFRYGRSAETQSAWPFEAARISAVQPSSSFASTSACCSAAGKTNLKLIQR